MIILDGHSLTIKQLVAVARQNQQVQLAESAQQMIKKGRQTVEQKLANNEVIYGLTTGFGHFSKVSITAEQVIELQLNIVRSHSVGVGPYLPQEVVKAMMLLRINTLICGHSGISLETVQHLVKMLNRSVLPLVPSQGSVGASGDLAPLSHIALGCIGEGEVDYNGQRMLAQAALELAGIEPITLKAKEGLALINGTQFMTAIGALAVHDAENLAEHADLAAALSTDALKGRIDHTDPDIHRLRPHKGQAISAEKIRKYMQDSQILADHRGNFRVQDAYSLRCAPQVHGASRDVIAHVKSVIEVEMNSVTDNPLIFPDEDKVLSGGNFHGQPIALAMDYLAMAVAEYANISERRIDRMLNPALSECLPAFLIEVGGLNSGLMMVQYTAAALVSENKVLAHPACVDSVPTSANQEDHVSMGSISARKCRDILQNSMQVVAIELMTAAQALEFHRPLKTSPQLEAVYSLIREHVAPIHQDRVYHGELLLMKQLVASDRLIRAAAEPVLVQTVAPLEEAESGEDLSAPVKQDNLNNVKLKKRSYEAFIQRPDAVRADQG